MQLAERHQMHHMYPLNSFGEEWQRVALAIKDLMDEHMLND